MLSTTMVILTLLMLHEAVNVLTLQYRHYRHPHLFPQNHLEHLQCAQVNGNYLHGVRPATGFVNYNMVDLFPFQWAFGTQFSVSYLYDCRRHKETLDLTGHDAGNVNTSSNPETPPTLQYENPAKALLLHFLLSTTAVH